MKAFVAGVWVLFCMDIAYNSGIVWLGINILIKPTRSNSLKQYECLHPQVQIGSNLLPRNCHNLTRIFFHMCNLTLKCHNQFHPDFNSIGFEGSPLPYDLQHRHPLLSTVTRKCHNSTRKCHNLIQFQFFSQSLSEFWGSRWNPVIGKLLQEAFYKPARRLDMSRTTAMLCCFLVHFIPDTSQLDLYLIQNLSQFYAGRDPPYCMHFLSTWAHTTLRMRVWCSVFSYCKVSWCCWNSSPARISASRVS